MIGQVKYYEIAYLLRPQLSQEEATSFETDLRTLLGSHSATIDSADSPRKKPLAYAIGKEREAYAGAIRMTAALEEVPAIQNALKKQKGVLRSIVLEWKRAPLRKKVAPQEIKNQEKKEPTVDEAVIDQKLEEILGTISNESQ